MQRRSVRFPIDPKKLPAAVREVVAAAIDEGTWGDAIDAFDEWLEESGERPPEVLAMLAWMLFVDASEVMVDEMTARGERALAMLAEAKHEGTATLRGQIERAVARDRKENEKTARAIATNRDKSLESMDPAALRNMAYKLGESKKPEDHAMAARAWLVSATHETEQYEIRDCLTRAALEFADAKLWDEAIPRLEDAIAHADEHPDDWPVADSFCRLLDKAVSDENVPAFLSRWKHAVAREWESPFPESHPSQEKYLAFAIEHQLGDVARHIAVVATRVRSKREMKSIQPLVDRAKAQ